MYTDKETQEIIETYQASPTPETVAALAERFQRSTKSIIGKLSREGIYQKQVYRSKTGELPITKKELVSMIGARFELPLAKLEGLDKAPKQVLKLLAEAPLPDEPV